MKQDDMALVREFAATQSEAAFTTLVNRHIGLVYSAALRQTGDPHLAEEITQNVFIILARKAAKLGADTILPAWLYRTALYATADALKQQHRRQAREQEAYMQSTVTNEIANADWQQLAPVLEDAMAGLGENDRAAVVLRYFENRPWQEVAAQLHLTEDAVQKRVTRALEKLRKILSKRGLTLTGTAIAGALTTNAVQAAPTTLAASITTAVCTGTGLTLATVAMTTFQKIALAATLAVTIGGGIYAAKQVHDDRAQIQTLQSEIAPITEQLGQMTEQHNQDTNTIAWLKEELAENEKNNFELLKLRGEVGWLRKKADALSKANQDLQIRTASGGIITPDANTNAMGVLQIHVKARFLSAPKAALTGIQFFLNSQIADAKSFTGILNNENFTNFYAQLRTRKDVEVLGESEVTSIIGRQFEVRATHIITVVTNFAMMETNDTVSIVPETTQVECGPILNATPRVLADGSTIALPVIASLTDFLGYSATPKTVPTYTKNGEHVDLPTVSPQFSVRESTASVNVFDHQTLVLKLDNKVVPTDEHLQNLDGTEVKVLNGDVLVFITATIVDAAGNRVNKTSIENGIPDQSSPASN